ncbi:uncharacterized protein LOC129588789 isoform X2 [Paramacrobiotus metropolitanus]|uniref:uncharacterized protein LOC129588789 isoform X2 n=1 Tax=Paramacrobiotus metropolitanus TaxID=2943436 RepID=UPI00244576A5|nr:uncharacterized protein LOC129588789 isoform X2 [Paramacrobiotus metropolitanus]XP_055339147.1 uncharacterized protein LOC129588789 isoform X2 [Paramacrobiotus metropolitanus]
MGESAPRGSIACEEIPFRHINRHLRHDPAYERDPQNTCKLPGRGNGTQLLQCPDETGFCLLGIFLAPDFNLITDEKAHLMGRNCARSDRDTQMLWENRTPGDLLACDKAALRKGLFHSHPWITFRCVCRHDNCNNQTLTGILAHYVHQETMRLLR